MNEHLIEDARALVPKITEGLDEVEARARDAAYASGRDPAEISLVVVTKGRPAAVALGAWFAGAELLGENRAPELAAKAVEIESAIAELKEVVRPPPEWHFVGHLQRNKVRQVTGVASVIHSLDSLGLATEIVKRSASPPRCLVEVNVAGEAQKYGVTPALVEEFIGGLDLVPSGFMCMAPRGAGQSEARAVFAQLARLRHDMSNRFPDLELADLSMGMTDDFEAAIAEGATILRVGRAIFSHLR